MDNSEVSKIFREIAKILEIKGDNPFRIRAYERASQNIDGMSENLEDFVKERKLTEIPGIGNDLADKIQEIIKTGRLKTYENLKKTLPQGLLDLLNIPGVGPKTAKLLFEKLRIKNIRDLERAIENHKLESIFGIKERTIENILKGIEVLRRGRERMNLAQAIQAADEFIDKLKKMPQVKRISPAGSLRRQKETVRDIDILAASAKPNVVMDAFTGYPMVKEILAKGETKASVRTKDDVQVDCRVVEEKSFGAALLYFTGAKNFNIKLRQMAIRRGLKINEYGIFKGNKYIAGRTEEEIFKTLKLAYIEPELREDNGEIELAKETQLPNLVELKDLKGDFHVHSKWSDGNNTIEEIALACIKKKYSYVTIADHSEGLKVAGGLSSAELKKKKKEIDKINSRLKNFRILYGTEVDIDANGNLDYKDEILKEFDIVVAAIHNGFKQSKEQLTKRMVKACGNKFVHIIAHPTGRLWGVRDAYPIDLEEIFKAARQTNTKIEINAFPQRLDLDSLNSRRAKEMKIKLAISTDAHTLDQLENMKLGLAVARRGWLTKEDVINTLEVEELLKEIKK